MFQMQNTTRNYRPFPEKETFFLFLCHIVSFFLDLCREQTSSVISALRREMGVNGVLTVALETSGSVEPLEKPQEQQINQPFEISAQQSHKKVHPMWVTNRTGEGA